MRLLRSSLMLMTFVVLGCGGGGNKPATHDPDEGSGGSGGGTGGSGDTGGSGGSTGGSGGDTGGAGGSTAGSGGSNGGSGGSAGGSGGSTGGSGGDTAPDAGDEGGGGDAPDPDGGAPRSDDGGLPPTEGPMIPGCTLKWSPSAMRDGTKAFEAAEMPDIQFPGGSKGTHPGVAHITAIAEHDAYRIDSHYMPPSPIDYDRVTQTGPMRTDRLRCETRGMVGPSGEVDLLNGQTWRLTWSLYLPSTLKGTGRFTHIMQMKYVDKGGGASGSPIVTVTLRSGDKMEVLFWIGGGSITTTDISQLHDKWLSADMTIKIGTAGSLHWVLKDGDKVVVDKTQNGTTWPSDGARLRPKWGIYRGITDGVQTTYIMLSDLRAYQCQ